MSRSVALSITFVYSVRTFGLSPITLIRQTGTPCRPQHSESADVLTLSPPDCHFSNFSFAVRTHRRTQIPTNKSPVVTGLPFHSRCRLSLLLLISVISGRSTFFGFMFACITVTVAVHSPAPPSTTISTLAS